MGDDGSDGGLGGLGDAPNEGTLGGTMSDSMGENSATMGGSISDAQADANASLGGFGIGDEGLGLGFGLTDSFTDAMSSVPGFMGMDTSVPMSQDEGILGKLSKMAQQAVLNTVLGKLGLNNPVGKGVIGLSQAAMNPDQDQGKNQAFNSVFNGMKGMAMSANPVAGLAMGLASAFGMPNQGMTGNAAPGVSMGNNSSGFGLGDLFNAGAQLYGYNKASGALDKQIGGLQSLFSPEGAYAQQLRQQLERRDAAAGRRSQYGPREVELMAALAQQAARSAPQLNQLQNQRAAMRGQGLQALMNFGQQSGITPWMANGLQGLFNSGISSGVSSGFLPSDTSGMNFSQYEQDPFSALGEF